MLIKKQLILNNQPSIPLQTNYYDLVLWVFLFLTLATLAIVTIRYFLCKRQHQIIKQYQEQDSIQVQKSEEVADKTSGKGDKKETKV